jgi:hypothetical protein
LFEKCNISLSGSFVLLSNVVHCESSDDLVVFEGIVDVGSSNSCNEGEASEFVLEYVRLGGRDRRREEIVEDRLLSPASVAAEESDLVLTSDNGRKNDTVLDLRIAGFSNSPFASAGLLGSGSLNSSFPFLSEAKYSSPRPKTT